MKKKIIGIVMCALLAFGVLGVAGCAGGSGDTTHGSTGGTTTEGDGGSEGASGPSGNISVYSREDGSGTRSAFVELMGVMEDDVDMTTTAASITNSTAVMMTSVAGDPNGIGYISLGSLDDSVKALQVNGVEATAENVKSGDYVVSRPFNIATKDDLSDAAQDFIDFILSADGQAIVAEEGYIQVVDDAEAFEPADVSGDVVVAGSSSVTPVMEVLAEAYMALNSNVDIQVQQSDSSTGMNMAIEGTCDIGMASREVKDSELAEGLTPTVIAQDGIAIIVNLENALDDITTDQVKAIYTGEATTWEDALAL